MVIKGRDLVHLGFREAHLGGQCDEPGGAEMTVAVLDLVQVFKQQVATARRLPEQFPNLGQGRGIHGTPARPYALAAPVARFFRVVRHRAQRGGSAGGTV